MQLELGENPMIWYFPFFLKKQTCKMPEKEGRESFSVPKTLVIVFTWWNIGGGGVRGCFKTDNYPKVLVNDL